MTSPKPEDVEIILKHLHPEKGLFDLVEAGIKGLSTAKGIPDLSGQILGQTSEGRQLQDTRQRLLALPAKEVARLAVQAKAEQAARRLANAAALEAARFYNQPAALADFQFWAEVENWTHDEAVALLLGRDPRVVSPEALAAELKTGTVVPGHGKATGRAAFHQEFENLNTRARRSDALNLPRLKPQAVLDWARSLAAVTVPPGMTAAIESKKSGSLPLTAESTTPGTGTARRWTPERLDALKAVRSAKGNDAAAEQFGISKTRLRKLLPGEDEPEPFAHGRQSWPPPPKRPTSGK